MAKDYTSTLNLPKTDFPMRANLAQREPDMLKRMEDKDLYHKMLARRAEKPLFLLHDGPPFSNGDVHMGTAMNKILKDFINKYKSMRGYRVKYTPGWDNHGMPIESAIIRQNKLDRKKMSIPAFRDQCHQFAAGFVEKQMNQFKRLGVLGDYENPYLTMNPSFEATEVKVFGEMYKKGYIYKGLKPVYWCPKDETALAEAEIEYQQDQCTSIYVKFRVKDDLGKLSGVDLANTYFVIWTTTPWTLPGNLAIAVHPRVEYVLVKANNEQYIVAGELCEKAMAAGGISDYQIVGTYKGQDFEYMKACHPFLERESLLVLADYVTTESGTGCVHTAPGFGADDYVTCKKYNMDIVVPVDDQGMQTEEAGPFAGMYYAKSNEAILANMKESGALFASEEMTHEYPHCWRCKEPIIFRATPQWFCSVDAFREEAMRACDDVEWMPAWGHDRMVKMINERADWCISRQRHWGLPIPVVYCEDCGQPICTDETIERISALFAANGSNAWYEKDVAEILPEGFRCPHCGADHFEKETDTLDGWFDSGSSHFAVIHDDPEAKWPADLYLEGADQYRGWFQSSLLTAVATKAEGAPYRAALTHGWVVDGQGKAMHKSLGNGIQAADAVKKYGADLCRLWVASSDYTVDVRVSDEIFKQLSEVYRKIRNSARILMANLGEDFDPNRDLINPDELYDIDKWALVRLNHLVADCLAAYDKYQFHIVYHNISNFCILDLSKLYIDITKDRLYTEKKDSKARKSAQTAMFVILDSLVRLLAPILTFTADEIWESMPHLASDNAESVFLNDIPEVKAQYQFEEVERKYEQLFAIRDDVMKALELARNEKVIGKSLEAKVEIFVQDEKLQTILSAFGEELATVFIVSQAFVKNEAAPSDAFSETESGIAVRVSVADGCKCDRCWMHAEQGTKTEDGFLCLRCETVLNG
ncbi:MAG: isoleucine--tRNA ligase [Clostridiales bacterium]|nr:isoleucine--tRNA ligase [Clostridiales bacterium]